MRKVTETIVQAFYHDRKARCVANTSTDGQTLFLHGNAIARHFKDAQGREGCDLRLADWNTPTTRERLNGLLSVMGYGINADKRGQPFVGVYNRKRLPYIGQHGEGFEPVQHNMPGSDWVRVYCPRDATPSWYGGTLQHDRKEG